MPRFEIQKNDAQWSLLLYREDDVTCLHTSEDLEDVQAILKAILRAAGSPDELELEHLWEENDAKHI